jgi:demethylmenaquinone methyltransferase/2-methoxy-6-polyprenyl-1,4-benzoquinol methylase
VFDQVAGRYDVMNDLMSLGLHRAWKRFAVWLARVQPGERVLDVATGSGDLARALGERGAQVWMSDINHRMLCVGRDRALDAGGMMPAVQCDAEHLPFPERSFDCVTVAFGLRNMTHKDKALAEMMRCAARRRTTARARVFPRLAAARQGLRPVLVRVLPWLGERVAGDAAAYRYLAESIRMHPDQETLATMMRTAGLEQVEYFNLAAGVVALHRGWKLG